MPRLLPRAVERLLEKNMKHTTPNSADDLRDMIRTTAPQRGLECIFGDGDTVCLRPLSLDSGGVPVPRSAPCPSEFVGLDTACNLLGYGWGYGPGSEEND